MLLHWYNLQICNCHKITAANGQKACLTLANIQTHCLLFSSKPHQLVLFRVSQTVYVDPVLLVLLNVPTAADQLPKQMQFQHTWTRTYKFEELLHILSLP